MEHACFPSRLLLRVDARILPPLYIHRKRKLQILYTRPSGFCVFRSRRSIAGPLPMNIGTDAAYEILISENLAGAQHVRLNHLDKKSICFGSH